jgi:P pilus assembly chaperone PapD
MIDWSGRIARSLILIAGACCLASVSRAQIADLNVSPKRLVLDQTSRAGAIYVFNRGAKPATYAVSLDDKVMTPDGRIRTLEEAAGAPDGAATIARARSARSMILFTPHRVTLEGGSSQVVRLRVLRPMDLAAGEYRAHLTVRELPPETVGLTAEQAAANENGSLSINITTLLGVSIPVIVRQGPPEVHAGIDGVSYAVGNGPAGGSPGSTPRVATVSLQLVRQGQSSLFGDVEIRRIVGGKPGELVGVLRGIGVYTEIDRRTVEIPLSRIPAPGARLAVVFRPQDAKPGEALATALLAVPS